MALWITTPALQAQLPIVSPSSLSFTYQINGQPPLQQFLYTSDVGVPTQFVVDQTAAPWVTIAVATPGSLSMGYTSAWFRSAFPACRGASR